MLKKTSQLNVLFGVQEYAEFVECERLFQALLQRGIVRQACWFLKPGYRSLKEHSTRAFNAGVKWIDAGGVSHSCPMADDWSKTDGGNSGGSDRTGLPGAWKRGLVDFVNCAYYLKRLSSSTRLLRKVLRQDLPDAVVIGQDPVGTELSFLAHSARSLGIPVLMVPYAMFNFKEYFEYSSRRPQLALNYSIGNRIAAKKWPQWSADDGTKQVLRLPGWKIVALEQLGLGQREPWVIGAGPVNLIAAESRRQLERYEGNGVPASRLRVTGSAVHDVLTEAIKKRDEIRRKLLEEAQGENDRPLVLCAWPPNIFPWANCVTPEYRSYAELVRSWTEVLVKVQERTGALILVRPHPKSLATEVEEAYKANFCVSYEDTAHLLAASDLFVTTASSVTGWAIAACIPTIDYDCFGTGYNDFDGVVGVYGVTSRDQFLHKVLEIAGDTTRRSTIQAEMAKEAASWGVLDGRATERIVETIVCTP